MKYTNIYIYTRYRFPCSSYILFGMKELNKTNFNLSK